MFKMVAIAYLRGSILTIRSICGNFDRDVELDRTRLKQLGIEFHTKFRDGLMEDLKQFL